MASLNCCHPDRASLTTKQGFYVMTELSSSNSSLKLSGRKPLGQILNEAGLISAQQIEIALRLQLESPQMKIGEIFAAKGWIEQQTADFFADEWHELLEQQQKQPLVYYLRQAGLLDENQINHVLKERNSRIEKVRFHHIAVEQGLVKQQTVDFFLRNLLGVATRRNHNISATAPIAPYKILQSYIRGETNFQSSQLKKIKLNHVTLRVVNLDNSDLTGAELKQANLSNSSLRFVNLTNANLEKAILQEVDFECACLNLVNLTDAHLEGANFTKANLRQADLRHSYLVNVCFRGANLRSTKLQGANLKGAVYDAETIFDAEFEPARVGMRLV